jgi:hypothetical protein
MNGRVDIGITNNEKMHRYVYGNNMNALFSLQDKIPAKQCISLREPLEGIWTSDKISDKFFSNENVEYLQNEIIQRVSIKTNGQYTIEKQDYTTLFVIMRGFFLQYSTNNNEHIQHQLDKLNNIVLGYCVDNVYSELTMYLKYVHDSSTLVSPLSNPVLSNMKDKTLEFKNWFR